MKIRYLNLLCGPLVAALLFPAFAKASTFAKASVDTSVDTSVDKSVGEPVGASVGAFLVAKVDAAGGEPASVATPSGPTAPAATPVAAQPQPRAEVTFKPLLSYGDRVLAEDTVWRGDVLVEGAVTVAPQATLSVEPGTVVRFKKSDGRTPVLVVQGRIAANGTKDEPVRFTSTFAAPAAGDWQGVILLGSEKKNLLENCRIDGAQTGLEALYSNLTLKGVRAERSTTGMRFQDALVQMEGGGASDCETGFSFLNSEATVRAANLIGNRVGISARKSSVYLEDGSLSMNRSAFSCDNCRVKLAGGAVLDNGRGVTLFESEGSVSGMKLVRNSDYGISLTGSRVQVNGNLITGNGDQGVLVFDGAGVAWDNVINGNSGYDVYNAGNEEFRAPNNYWGEAGPKINDNGGRGKVGIVPQRKTAPGKP